MVKEKGCGKTFYFDGDKTDYEFCGDNNYLCYNCKKVSKNKLEAHNR